LVKQDSSPSQSKKKKRQHTNNLCLYCGELDHVAYESPKKREPHATHTIFVTIPQLEELENKHV
jgi:hypothetical protein